MKFEYSEYAQNYDEFSQTIMHKNNLGLNPEARFDIDKSYSRSFNLGVLKMKKFDIFFYERNTVSSFMFYYNINPYLDETYKASIFICDLRKELESSFDIKYFYIGFLIDERQNYGKTFGADFYFLNRRIDQLNSKDFGNEIYMVKNK